MRDERLGRAAGAVLRELDRPATDPDRSIGRVMTQVRLTQQAASPRRLPFLHRDPGLARDRDSGAPLDHPGHVASGRFERPVLAPTRGTRSMFTASKLMVAGVGAVLVATFLASGGLSPSGPSAPGAAASALPETQGVAWSTDRVILTADDFMLEASDKTFGEAVWPRSVDSDPGDSDRWTLEVAWDELDVEQRLNMSFGSDGTDWWVDEIRTYDGLEPGEWVFAYGPFFTTKLGETFEGDVTIDLLGEGRDGDRDNLIPAVLSFSGMRLAVSPGTGPTPGPENDVVPEQSPVPVDDLAVPASPSAAQRAANAADDLCGSGDLSPDAETVCRALSAAFGDPQAGEMCLSVEDARQRTTDVLTELEATGWSIAVDDAVRDDGCAVPSVIDDGSIRIFTGLPPDVVQVLEDFRDLSLQECLEADAAVDMLTAQLEAIGHSDFMVQADPSMLGGPSDRIEEIRAHSDAGCAIYVGTGAGSDGSPIYYIHVE